MTNVNQISIKDDILCKMLIMFVFSDQLFLILYKELYYRHVYARVQVCIITGRLFKMSVLQSFKREKSVV